MADSIGGYPTSGLERFVTGFQTGWEKMTDLRKKADDLETQLAVNEKRRAMSSESAKALSGGDEGSSTKIEDPYATAIAPTTGSGGGGGGSSGGRGGGGGGQWGDYAQPIINYFTQQGYKLGAIQGIMANGISEGGFANPWYKHGTENTYGHWGFHRGGELDGYEKWAKENNVTDLPSSLNQARYVDYWIQKNRPDFKNLEDPAVATNRFHTEFERPADQTPGLRLPALARVQQYMTPPAAAPSATPAIGSSASPAPESAYTPHSKTDAGSEWANETLGYRQPSAPAPAPAPAPTAAAPDPYNYEQMGGSALAPTASALQTPARVPAGPASAPPSAVTSTPGGTNGIVPRAALSPGGPAQVIANELAQRPTFGQLAQLAQQYLPAAKAALMPTNSGLYG